MWAVEEWEVLVVEACIRLLMIDCLVVEMDMVMDPTRRPPLVPDMILRDPVTDLSEVVVEDLRIHLVDLGVVILSSFLMCTMLKWVVRHVDMGVCSGFRWCNAHDLDDSTMVWTRIKGDLCCLRR